MTEIIKGTTMDHKEFCGEHSGCISDIKTLQRETTEQWVSIREIQKRPPVWATTVMSVLSFLLGCALTYAGLAVK